MYVIINKVIEESIAFFFMFKKINHIFTHFRKEKYKFWSSFDGQDILMSPTLKDVAVRRQPDLAPQGSNHYPVWFENCLDVLTKALSLFSNGGDSLGDEHDRFWTEC